jgi:hypothetical protein
VIRSIGQRCIRRVAGVVVVAAVAVAVVVVENADDVDRLLHYCIVDSGPSGKAQTLRDQTLASPIDPLTQYGSLAVRVLAKKWYRHQQR